MTSTVLIADDEPQLLRLLVRIFERGGFRALAAKDGDAAIEMFEQHVDEIDVLVLDVIIPPRGVAEVLEAVSGRKPSLGLVLTSGDQLSPGLQELLHKQGGVFLRKPFLPKLLLRTVQELGSAAEAE